MAKRAAEITADHLHERLAIANPDDELGKLDLLSMRRSVAWRIRSNNCEDSPRTHRTN
jgi:hypothetical protein